VVDPRRTRNIVVATIAFGIGDRQRRTFAMSTPSTCRRASSRPRIDRSPGATASRRSCDLFRVSRRRADTRELRVRSQTPTPEGESPSCSTTVRARGLRADCGFRFELSSRHDFGPLRAEAILTYGSELDGFPRAGHAVLCGPTACAGESRVGRRVRDLHFDARSRRLPAPRSLERQGRAHLDGAVRSGSRAGRKRERVVAALGYLGSNVSRADVRDVCSNRYPLLSSIRRPRDELRDRLAERFDRAISPRRSASESRRRLVEHERLPGVRRYVGYFANRTEPCGHCPF